MSAHTPGPWRIDPRWGDESVATVNGGYLVADCGVFGTSKTQKTNVANARLIAAAPDLLSAAIEASSEPEHGDYRSGIRCGLEDRGITDRYEVAEYGWHQAFDYVSSVLRAAIAKATGEQP